MELQVIGSSSEGNCYLLHSRQYNETLILEAGCSPTKVNKAMGFKIDSIVGCIVTHRHKDHAMYVQDYIHSGVYVLALQDVWDKEKYSNKFAKGLELNKKYKFGNFEVLPLPVDHDVPCVAYAIKHPDMGKLMFITDTMCFRYKMPMDVNHLIVEANYSDSILEKNVENGVIHPAMKRRLMETHMEIETTANIIRANIFYELENVVLIHLSNNNSNATEFRDYIKGVAGVPTYVAEPGMKLDLTGFYNG